MEGIKRQAVGNIPEEAMEDIDDEATPVIEHTTKNLKQIKSEGRCSRCRSLNAGSVLLVFFSVLLFLLILKPQQEVATGVTLPEQESRTSLELIKLAESLERRTARLQNERRWPKKSLEKLDKLLAEYGALHADILAGKVEGGKFIRWKCFSSCGGWGDRIRGIMTILTLAIIFRRAFVVELSQVGVQLNEFYDDPNIHWSYNPAPENKFRIECNDPANKSCNCLNESIANWTSLNVITVRTNLDCAGYFGPMLPGWRDDDGGIEDVLNWKGILMDWVFPPSLKLRSLIQNTIPQGFDVGVHIRSGYISHRDFIRYHGSPEALALDYANCLAKVHPEVATVYIAADNSTFKAEVAKNISAWTTSLDSSWVGELGHVQELRKGGPKMAWRMMVDFEILRRAKILLVAPSGFSLIAYKTRVYADSIAYAPLRSRNVGKCERIFVNNTSKGYYILNAYL